MKLHDKVAVVTGGARGIGKSICEALAADGAKLAIVDIMPEVAEATAAEFRGRGVDAKAFAANVAKVADVDALMKAIVEAFGKIDILVNNAGITKDNLLMRMREEEWDAVIAVNLKGVFNCMKAVCRPMMKQESGKIINIASVVGRIGNPGQMNYSASKGGVIAMTKSAARELASRNICVNAVAPGFILTDMTAKLPEEAKQQFLQNIPLKRAGTAEDVAKAVRFLAGPESDYITAQVISVDGGMYLGS